MTTPQTPQSSANTRGFYAFMGGKTREDFKRSPFEPKSLFPGDQKQYLSDKDYKIEWEKGWEKAKKLQQDKPEFFKALAADARKSDDA